MSASTEDTLCQASDSRVRSDDITVVARTILGSRASTDPSAKNTDTQNGSTTRMITTTESDVDGEDEVSSSSSSSSVQSDFVDVGEEIEAIIESGGTTASSRGSGFVRLAARHRHQQPNSSPRKRGGGGGEGVVGVGGGKNSNPNDIRKGDDTAMRSDGYYLADGFGFDRPIEPLCIATNHIGSRVVVGHTRGFILYTVRRVDGGEAVFETELDLAREAGSESEEYPSAPHPMPDEEKGGQTNPTSLSQSYSSSIRTRTKREDHDTAHAHDHRANHESSAAQESKGSLNDFDTDFSDVATTHTKNEEKYSKHNVNAGACTSAATGNGKGGEGEVVDVPSWSDFGSDWRVGGTSPPPVPTHEEPFPLSKNIVGDALAQQRKETESAQQGAQLQHDKRATANDNDGTNNNDTAAQPNKRGVGSGLRNLHTSSSTPAPTATDRKNEHTTSSINRLLGSGFLPFTQLVPIVSYDEDTRLRSTDKEGVKRPFSHLERYGIPIINKNSKKGARKNKGANGRRATDELSCGTEGQMDSDEEVDEDEDDDCDGWGTASTQSEGQQQENSADGGGEKGSFAGAGTVCLLFETMYVGVVGGGPRPIGPPNTLYIFNGETLNGTIKASGAIERIHMISGSADFTTQVAMLTRDQFFLIYLFDGTLVYRAPTHTLNDCLSQPLAVNERNCFISFPAAAKGGVDVAKYADSSNIVKTCSIPRAHAHPISSIALSSGADLCVTCSVHGTLIRVWSIRAGSNSGRGGGEDGSAAVGTMLSELRTSPIPCRIRHIGVSTQGNYIYALVNSVNICVFFIGKEEEAKAYDVSTKDQAKALAKNQSSYLSKLSFLSSFFESKWAACTLGLPPAMLPAALLRGAEYYGRRRRGGGGRSASFATDHTAAPSSSSAAGQSPPLRMPSQQSLTGGLLSRWYGGVTATTSTNASSDSPADITAVNGGGALSRPPIGRGDPVVPVAAHQKNDMTSSSFNTTANSSATAQQGGGGYYSGWMSSLYGVAAKAATTVAAASGVSVGGYGSGVVVLGGQEHAASKSNSVAQLQQAGGGPRDPILRINKVGGDSMVMGSKSLFGEGVVAGGYALMAGGGGSGSVSHNGSVAKDINGRTADDVLQLWWEQRDYIREMADVVRWDQYDLEGFLQHRVGGAVLDSDFFRGGKKGKGKAGAGNSNTANKGNSSLPPTVAGSDAIGIIAGGGQGSSVGGVVGKHRVYGNGRGHHEAHGEEELTAVPKEILCVANAYGELMRIEFSPVGGTLVSLPVAPPKE